MPAQTDLRAFHCMISTLLRQLGVEDFKSQRPEDEDFYTITVDEGTAIHLVGAQDGLVHLWSFPGRLPEDVSRSALVALLATNAVTFDYPSIHLGLQGESGELMLWMRHPLAQIDVESVRALFEGFVERGASVRQWIESGAASANGSGTEGVPHACQSV